MKNLAAMSYMVGVKNAGGLSRKDVLKSHCVKLVHWSGKFFKAKNLTTWQSNHRVSAHILLSLCAKWQ